MSNGICNGCNHSVENHFNTTVYKRTRDTVEEIPATALIEEFSKGSKDLKSLIDGIIKKIEDLNTKITNAMDKLETLRVLKRQEEQIVNIAINKNT